MLTKQDQEFLLSVIKKKYLYGMHWVHVYMRNALKELGLIFVISFLVNTLCRWGEQSFKLYDFIHEKIYIYLFETKEGTCVFLGLYNYLQLRHKIEK